MKLRISNVNRALIAQGIHYQPLNHSRKEIRVLTLLPRLTTRRDEPIQCTLEHVSLDDYTSAYKAWKQQSEPRSDTPEERKAYNGLDTPGDVSASDANHGFRGFRYNWGDYIAVSYCWGSQEAKTQIFVNGRSVSVTINLEAALRSVYNLPVFEDPGLQPKVWLDAVCINQADLKECEAEIRRMRNIFGGAKQVIASLGQGWKDEDLAVEVAQKAKEALETGVFCFGGADMKEMSKERLGRLERTVAVAHGPVTVAFGDSWLFLDQIRDLILVLFADLVLIRAWFREGECRQLCDSFGAGSIILLLAMDPLRRLSELLEEGTQVTYEELNNSLLGIAMSALCTKNHDKIYGILGLLPPQLSSMIPIDYSVPEEEVFVSFSKSLIQTTKDLDCIFLRDCEQTMTPTWATDWRLQGSRTNAFQELMFNANKRFGPCLSAASSVLTKFGIPEVKRADMGCEPYFEFSADDKILFCRGIYLGTLDGLSASFTNDLSLKEQHILPTNHDHPYGSDEAAAKALLCTLYMNPLCKEKDCILFHIPWVGKEADADAEALEFHFGQGWLDMKNEMLKCGWSGLFTGSSYMLNLEIARRRFGMFPLGGRLFKDYFAQTVSQCPFGSKDFEEMHLFAGAWASRRLATLNTGHFALVLAPAQPGDSVYVITGCSMPVVLRQSSERGNFEVVGECYVEGYMSGETIKALQDGTLTQERIMLC